MVDYPYLSALKFTRDLSVSPAETPREPTQNLAVDFYEKVQSWFLQSWHHPG